MVNSGARGGTYLEAMVKLLVTVKPVAGRENLNRDWSSGSKRKAKDDENKKKGVCQQFPKKTKPRQRKQSRTYGWEKPPDTLSKTVSKANMKQVRNNEGEKMKKSQRVRYYKQKGSKVGEDL